MKGNFSYMVNRGVVGDVEKLPKMWKPLSCE